LDPTFTGISSTENIRNAVLVRDGRYQALEHYLAEEISTHWPVIIAYERTKWLNLTYNSTIEPIEASFMSGGYQSLGIDPEIGSLNSLEFPHKGSQIKAAITESFWKNKLLQDPNIVGKQITVSGKLVTVVAVMPTSFKSFRKGREVDIVIPFAHLTELTSDSEQEILPDTQSFILGERSVLNNIENQISSYLMDESFLFGDDLILLNHAIGVDSLEYTTVSHRIYLLETLFIILFLFCFLAFIAYYSGNTEKKQREHNVRRLCGANRMQILLQEGLDIILTASFILVCCVLMFPFIDNLVQVFLPHIASDYLRVAWREYMILLTLGFIVLTVTLSVINLIQYKLFATYVGRGQSIGLGQKLQSYFLASLLVCFSSLALFIASVVLKHQIEIGGKSFGFDVQDRFIISFDFPKTHSGTFYTDDLAKLVLENIATSDVIDQVSITSVPAFLDKMSFAQFYTPDLKPVGSGQHGNVILDHISPNYFRVSGIKLLKGNELVWGNYWQVLVNQTLWEKYFKNYSLSEAKLIQIDDSGEERALDIIGVVEDTLLQGRDQATQPIVYRLIPTITGFESLFIESSGTITQIENAVKKGIDGIDVNFGKFKVESLEVLSSKENAPRQALLAVSMSCALLMFVSTLIFAYNSISQLVKKGAKEIALRNALGAGFFTLIFSEFKFFFALLVPCFIGLYALLDIYHRAFFNALLLNPPASIYLILIPGVALTAFMFIIFQILFLQKLKTTWNHLT
jgi:hypothetical protein